MPTAASFLDEKRSAASFLDEPVEERLPEREEYVAPAPRPPVYGDESGIPTNMDPRQRKRLEILSEMAAARGEGEKLQAAEAELERQYRSIERFTPSGILNQPERFARAFAAPNAPEIPERFQPGQPVFPIPEPKGTNVAAGFGQLGVQLLNSLQTPEMIVTAPAAATPVGRALFAADMGRHIPEQVEQAAQVIGDIESTPAEKVVAGGQPVLTSTMTGLLGKSPAPIPDPILRSIETIRRVDATVHGALNRTIEAAAKSTAEKRVSDQVQQLEKPIERGIPDAEAEFQRIQAQQDRLEAAQMQSLGKGERGGPWDDMVKRLSPENKQKLFPNNQIHPLLQDILLRRMDVTKINNQNLDARLKQAKAIFTQERQVIDVESVSPRKELSNALQEPITAEGVLRQERPEVGLQEVRQPQAKVTETQRTETQPGMGQVAGKAAPANNLAPERLIPPEPARAQGGEEGQVLLRDIAREKEIETKIDELTADKPRWAENDPQVEPLKAEMRALRTKYNLSKPSETPAAKLFRIAEMSREELTKTGTVAVEQLAVEAGPKALPELIRLRDATETKRLAAEETADVSNPESINEHTDLAQKVGLLNEAIKQIEGRPNAKPKETTKTQTQPSVGGAGGETARDISGLPEERLQVAQSGAEAKVATSAPPAASQASGKTGPLTKDAAQFGIQDWLEQSDLPHSPQLAEQLLASNNPRQTLKEAFAGGSFRPKTQAEFQMAVDTLIPLVERTKTRAEAGAGAAKAQPELAAEAETQGAIATMGPPLMPTPPAGAPATPVKPISQIIRDLAKGLDLPIRFGRLTTGKYGGYFKKNPNLIGAKLANDMPIVAHEAGHKLDTIYPFTKDASIFPELEALGDPAVAGSRSSWTPSKSGVYKRSEGLAEFIRHWLTDPAQAQKLAPDTHTLFERVLAANEDLSGTMRQAQSDIQLWKNAPQEARLDSSISRSDPNKSRYRLPNLMRDLVDDLHFLRMAVDDAKVSGPLPPSQNPYQLARTLRGSFGMADTFVTKGIVDFKTKEVRLGTDLETALKPISGRIDEFRRWVVAKRAKELRAQGKESGLNLADVDFVANKYNADPAFQEAFTKVKVWNDGLLQYSVDAGLIAPESAAAMRELHQDYVPFHRLFEVGAGEAPSVTGGGSGRGLNAGKPGSLKRLTGSQRDIVDPLETMVKNAYTMITTAEKNAINTAVADLAPKTDMGRWVERVAAPKELVKVELERIRKQLEDAGADLTGVPDDLLMSFFKPSGRAPFGENIIKVNRAGQQEFYRLNKDLFDTFHALDQDSSSRLLKLMSVPAQLLRAGVTLTPDFALSNAIRDTFGAAVNSKYTSYPFQATFRGIGALLNNPKLVSEWAAAGGKQSIEANYFDRAKLQKFVTDRITKDLTPAEQALVVVKSPLTALRKFTGTLEEATRLGEYQAALKQLTAEGMPIGEARRQAAFEARDLQDFAKGGAQTKIVRSLAAFWNAGLQGNIRLAQSFRQRPFQTTLKGLAFITLPKLLEQAVNWNDEDYWDRPQWERDVFFMIPIGKDANDRTEFLRLPTPFEMGIIFGTGPGRMLQSLREKNPEALKDFPKVMLKQGIPNPTPQSILTMLEVNAGKGGYSFFRGRPIVPSSLQNAPPEMQFTSQNSLTAKKAGDLMGISPAKVDYAIAGLTGGVGRQLTHQVSDRAISAVTGEERTAESTMPGARFVATPAGTQSEAVERFYKALEEANADAERVKAGLPSQGAARNATRLNRVAGELSDLRKLARLENDPVKRQAINLRLAEKARNAFRPTPNPNP